MLARPKPTLIDLFCGCSGFGYGARQAGFDVKLSVDIDRVLSSSYTANFSTGQLLNDDVSSLDGKTLLELVGGPVDGIIGGPPCQGFSSIGKADPSDPRRELIDHFFRIVAEVTPRFFVMENVRGLLFDKNRQVLDSALQRVAGRYDLIGPICLDASHYGAATKRERVFVIGVDRGDVDAITLQDIASAKRPAATVEDAIYDLVQAVQVGEADVWRYTVDRQPSEYAKGLRSAVGTFTSHRKTPHLPHVAERFARVQQGGVDSVGRHPRLSWDKQCPTLRAGTGADRGSFQAVRPLHPEEHRVITVREAARLQGFPDDFQFHSTVWHSFRMIGNSVSPVIAYSLLDVIRQKVTASPATAG